MLAVGPDAGQRRKSSHKGVGMTGHKLAAAVGGAALVLGCSAAVAYAASSATVKIVLPPGANAGIAFTYTVKGTFKASKLTGPRPRSAYIIGLKQPAKYACRSTEPADWTKVGPSATAFKVTKSGSPFSFGRVWHVPSSLPKERFCVYVYSQQFASNGHSQGAKELASSTVTFPS